MSTSFSWWSSKNDLSLSSIFEVSFDYMTISRGCLSVWLTSSERGSQRINPLRVVLGPPPDLWLFITTCYLWLNLFDLNSMHPPEKERLVIFISPLPHTWERDSSGFKALTSRESKTAQLFRSRSKLFYIRIHFIKQSRFELSKNLFCDNFSCLFVLAHLFWHEVSSFPRLIFAQTFLISSANFHSHQSFWKIVFTILNYW